MTYQVQFTDSTNPNKQPIKVADGTVNTSATSLAFAGRGYPGYAPIIADDLLHLLENFAAPNAPINPVQGQLWYDTSVNVLKVYDSTSWSTAGNLKKSTSAPAIANSIAGDLWANTATNQLYLFTGGSWVLIGPQFSTGTNTGPIVESIIDTNNITHNVIGMYANNNLISVISKEKFIPKIPLAGFNTIYEGINLSSVDATYNSTTNPNPTRLYGTATSSDALLVNNIVVNSNNFLRSDVISTSNNQLNIRSDQGLQVGANLGFAINIENGSPALKSTVSGVGLNIKMTDSAGVTNTVLRVDSNQRVSINGIAPQSELDVAGLITASSGLNITGARNSTYARATPFTTATGSIVTQGGLSVGLDSNFGGKITVYGQATLSNVDASGNPLPTSVLVPGYTTNSAEATSLNLPNVAIPLYDIGTATRPFRNIYATNFSGNFSGVFSGTLEGSINGTAAGLASPTVFSIIGDVSSNTVSFNGQTETGTAVFTTQISSNFVSSKTPATDSFDTDVFLTYRSGTGLMQMPKSVLLSHVPTIPVGTILPFAGTSIPAGYLLCDGSEVLISEYSTLYSKILFNYKDRTLLKGAGTFALPDLRGRFPLGADNMNNGKTVPSSDGSGNLISTTTDLNGNISSSAKRVNESTASVVGLGNTLATGTATLTSNNLPDHTHTLNNGHSQYFAVNTPNEAADDTAQPNKGTTGGAGTGSAILNTGGVNGSSNSPINIMNPYLTINYIIFTGNI
jgi:microcystin-dependent protein